MLLRVQVLRKQNAEVVVVVVVVVVVGVAVGVVVVVVVGVVVVLVVVTSRSCGTAHTPLASRMAPALGRTLKSDGFELTPNSTASTTAVTSYTPTPIATTATT